MLPLLTVGTRLDSSLWKAVREAFKSQPSVCIAQRRFPPCRGRKRLMVHGAGSLAVIERRLLVEQSH